MPLIFRKCNLTDVVAMESLDAQYVKIQKNYPGVAASGLPFHGFVELLLDVARKKYPEGENLVDALRSLMHFCQLQLRHHGVRSARLRATETGPEENEDGRTSLKQIYLLPSRIVGTKGYQRILKELRRQQNEKHSRQTSAEYLRMRRSESEGRIAKRRSLNSPPVLPKIN